MGKRLRRGGGSLSPFSSTLICRIDSMKLSSSSNSDFVIQRLRERYPDYAREKLRPFSVRVEEVLQYLRNSSNRYLSDGETSQPPFSDGEADVERHSRKKRRREDVNKAGHLHAESDHLRQRPSTKVSFFSASQSSDCSVSTLDDAAFEKNIEPEFDITKYMLREKYTKKSEQNIKKRDKERNVEIECDIDDRRKASTKGSFFRKDVPVLGQRVGCSNVVPEASGRKGPRLQDLGGMMRVIEELMHDVIVPFYHLEPLGILGVKPFSGILLHGPPGCGKTKLVHAISNEIGVPLYKISSTEVVSSFSGASEKNIRDLFKKAYRTAPSIVFIDEIDAIASKRENLRGMECRIVTELLTCMENKQALRSVDTDSDPAESDKTSDRMSGYVLVIGATNRPDAVDQALRRPGRFDKEIALSVPDENARAEILSVLTRFVKLEGEFNLFMIARITPGFVGADLEALVKKAGLLALNRILNKRSQAGVHNAENFDWRKHPLSPEEIDKLRITMFDFEEAAKQVQPSTRREGFSSIPNIKWEDVGGLDLLRKEFSRYIVEPIKCPKDYEDIGVDREVGFLLYGPPGCGKTLIAKALANEAGANFIHIKGPEILNKYVGESEKEVRNIFIRARTCSPCIIFFDEIDALTIKKGTRETGVGEQLLAQLLVELTDRRPGVYVIGATNSPEMIESSLLRPGRFGRIFYVSLPTAEERELILKALVRKMSVSPDIDYKALVRRKECMNLSGADLACLVSEAGMAALDEKKMCIQEGKSYVEPLVIKSTHFEQALKNIIPSVSEERRRHYDALSLKFRANTI